MFQRTFLALTMIWTGLATVQAQPAPDAPAPPPAASHVGLASPPANAPLPPAPLMEHLDLTDAQRPEVEAILAAHHERVEAAQATLLTELAEVLTAEQLERFQQSRPRPPAPPHHHRSSRGPQG